MIICILIWVLLTRYDKISVVKFDVLLFILSVKIHHLFLYLILFFKSRIAMMMMVVLTIYLFVFFFLLLHLSFLVIIILTLDIIIIIIIIIIIVVVLLFILFTELSYRPSLKKCIVITTTIRCDITTIPSTFPNQWWWVIKVLLACRLVMQLFLHYKSFIQICSSCLILVFNIGVDTTPTSSTHATTTIISIVYYLVKKLLPLIFLIRSSISWILSSGLKIHHLT